jgi:3-hydroxyisobutyrate dehydrogenase-like beta-hydroxyacid dehydrogenase
VPVLTTVGWADAAGRHDVEPAALARAGHRVTVWRPPGTGAPPTATVPAVAPSDLASADVVFVTAEHGAELDRVVAGPDGLLSGPDRPAVVVDCSRTDDDAGGRVRTVVRAAGVGHLSVPMGDGGTGPALLVSGARETFVRVRPLLRCLAESVCWVGPGERAKVVRVCHDLFLGMLTQALCEVTALAEKSGVPRERFLRSLDDAALTGGWLARRTPALLALDWTPVRTTEALCADLDHGLAVARAREVPMPLAFGVQQRVQEAIGRGYRYADFLALFQLQAEAAGMDLAP